VVVAGAAVVSPRRVLAAGRGEGGLSGRQVGLVDVEVLGPPTAFVAEGPVFRDRDRVKRVGKGPPPPPYLARQAQAAISPDRRFHRAPRRDLAGLRRRDVDLLRGTIRVEHAVQEVGGCSTSAREDAAQPPRGRAARLPDAGAERPP
jgi:hypothetical protein